MSEKPPVEKIAEVKKASPQKQFVDRFINTDAKSIFDSFIEEMLMPGIYDLGMFIWNKMWDKGDNKSFIQRSSLNQGNNKTNYSKKFKMRVAPTTMDPSDDTDYSEYSKPRYDQLVVESKTDAAKIINHITSYIAQYDQFDRGQLYALFGITGDSADAKWGWDKTNWSGGSWRRVFGGGYLLLLPEIKYFVE